MSLDVIINHLKTNVFRNHRTFPLQVMPDGSQIPLSYRYTVQANTKVNAFKPKELQQEDNAAKPDLRAAIFGSLWCSKFNQLPKAPHIGVVWEAPIFADHGS